MRNKFSRLQRYQMMLSEYEIRRKRLREEIKAKYGKFWGVDEYKDRVKNISNRIQLMKAYISRIQAQRIIINESARLVCDFLCIEKDEQWQGYTALQNCIRDTPHYKMSKDLILAKKIFCKYILEQNIFVSTLVNEYLGSQHKLRALRLREDFTKSFKTNSYHHQQWRNFLQFVKEKTEYNEQSKAA